MKNLYHSNATIDTFQNNPHNCPSCRCKSTEPLGKLRHIISQPSFNNSAREQNLYLSTDLSEPTSTDRITMKAYQSTIFNNPNKIVFKNSTGVSSKQTNISFSYTSPPKNKKHHSSESKFNTKRFKQTHFPQISHDQSLQQISIYSKPKENNPYYQVYTKQKTPEKHKVLKMKKKEKSRQRLQVASKDSSQKSIPYQEITIQRPQYNDYSLDEPKNTPINALWMHGSQKTQKQLSNQEVRRFTSRQNAPASIEYIKHENISSKSINKVSPLAANRTDKRYPTVQSLEVYEALRVDQNGPYRIKSRHEEQTSLRFVRQASRQSSEMKYESEDIEMARSISEQLQLNYDYYYPQDETDKSLSIQVTL